jgi:hypothetical protein
MGDSYDRESIVEIFGEKIILKLERTNCEPTSRLMDDCDEVVEFAACIDAIDCDGNDAVITAYYYQDAEDVTKLENDDLHWEIDDYGIDYK